MSQFTIYFSTDGGAFVEAGTNDEIARILRKVADEIEHTSRETSGAVRDINGNTIGKWARDFDAESDDEIIRSHYVSLREAMANARVTHNRAQEQHHDYLIDHYRVIHPQCFTEFEDRIIFDPYGGTSIGDAIRVALREMKRSGKPVAFTFNAKSLMVETGDDYESVLARYIALGEQ